MVQVTSVVTRVRNACGRSSITSWPASRVELACYHYLYSCVLGSHCSIVLGTTLALRPLSCQPKWGCDCQSSRRHIACHMLEYHHYCPIAQTVKEASLLMWGVSVSVMLGVGSGWVFGSVVLWCWSCCFLSYTRSPLMRSK